MKRVLLDSGKFMSYKEVLARKEEPKVVKESVEVVESSTPAKAIGPVVLDGEETNAELKAMLDERNVEYSKSANKAKLLDALAPYMLQEDEVDSDGL